MLIGGGSSTVFFISSIIVAGLLLFLVVKFRKVTPLYPKISAITVFISFILYSILKIMDLYLPYAQRESLKTAKYSDFVMFLCLLALLNTVICLIYLAICKNKKTIWFLGAVLSGVFVLMILFNICFSQGKQGIEYISGDGQHTIVIYDNSSLLHGSYSIYEQVYPWLMLEIGTYSTKYPNAPGGRFIWHEETFEFYYTDIVGNETVKTFHYAK